MRIMIVWAMTGETTCGDIIGAQMARDKEVDPKLLDALGVEALTSSDLETIYMDDDAGNRLVIDRGASIEGWRERCTWHDRDSGERVHVWLALGVD